MVIGGRNRYRDRKVVKSLNGVRYKVPTSIAKPEEEEFQTLSLIYFAVTPTESITYTVIATTDGCSVSDTLYIKVYPSIVPSDGLTPNGDGINDVWIIGNLSDFPNVEVIVFNRWGSQVFHSKGYEEPFDGKNKNGKKLPVGTYFYVITYNDEIGTKPDYGSVTIMR